MKRLAFLLFAIAANATAQQKLVESIEVRVVNVDVVVTHRDGHPVTGLTKDDFEITENKKKQTITNFDEVVATPSSRPVGESVPEGRVRGATFPKFILVFVDTNSLEKGRRAEVMQALEHFVNEKLQASDQLSIVTWNRGAKAATPFTSDKAALLAAIAKVGKEARIGPSFDEELQRVKAECMRWYTAAEQRLIDWPQAFTKSKFAVMTYEEQSAMSARRLIDDLRNTIAHFGGLPGKKALVFAGAHMPERPGAELYDWLHAQFRQQLMRMRTDETMPGHSPTLFLLEDVVRQANAHGVTLYFLDGAAKADTTRSAELADVQSDSIREASLRVHNTADAFRSLADATGGLMMNRWTHFDVAFDAVDRDLGAYYSIGYKPSDPRDDKRERSIAVTTKNPAYTVRARRTYTPKTLETEISERLIANAFHEGVTGEFGIELAADTPKRDGRNFRVPIALAVPPNVTLMPNGNQLTGGYTMFLIVASADGEVSKLMRAQKPIRIAAGSESSLRSKPLVFSATLLMKRGRNTISIAVVDQVSDAVGYVRTSVMAE